jgi:hypothetical protein
MLTNRKPDPQDEPASTGLALDDPAVADALDAYLRELAAGQQPDPEAFFARFPAVRNKLAGCVEAAEFVQRVAAEIHNPFAH